MVDVQSFLYKKLQTLVPFLSPASGGTESGYIRFSLDQLL